MWDKINLAQAKEKIEPQCKIEKATLFCVMIYDQLEQYTGIMYNLLLISDCDLKKLHKNTITASEYVYV